MADTTTAITIMPSFDKVIEPESLPDAPASLSVEELPPELPASPAVGPLPGCSGLAVASDEKTEATEAADIDAIAAGLNVVVGVEEMDVSELCAIVL